MSATGSLGRPSSGLKATQRATVYDILDDGVLLCMLVAVLDAWALLVEILR